MRANWRHKQYRDVSGAEIPIAKHYIDSLRHEAEQNFKPQRQMTAFNVVERIVSREDVVFVLCWKHGKHNFTLKGRKIRKIAFDGQGLVLGYIGLILNVLEMHSIICNLIFITKNVLQTVVGLRATLLRCYINTTLVQDWRHARKPG